MQTVNILIVEDRTDWQTIVGNDVTQAGYTPYAAPSYTAALQALQERAFALAIIDPVLDINNRFNRDGLSVLQQIRTLHPQMPLIIMTGSFTRDVQQSLQQLCPNVPVLPKESWDTPLFMELVQSLLGTPATLAQVAAERESATPVEEALLLVPPISQAHGLPRVLLVENRPDWQTIVSQVLEDATCFWRVAASAQAALHELEQERFHLVVLDLKLQTNELPLPSSEGWLLLDHLVETYPSTKVLILSGKACAGDVAELLTHYPVVGFIEKQRFTPQSILDAVAEVTRAPELRIQTLGQFRIWRNGQAIALWERPQAETVVKLLLVRRAQGGRVMAADELITRLWPDADEQSGRKKLLPLISNARHTLEPEIEPRDSHFIVRCSNGYFFELAEGITWDVLQFRAHMERGLQHVQQEGWLAAIEELEQARALYQGDFLTEDLYSDWAMEVRHELTSTFCEGLVALADSYAALGDSTRAIDACELALRKDPLREGVYRRLMCLHMKHDDKGQALKVYRDCRLLFEELFGERPTPLTHRLAQMVAGDNAVALEYERWV